MVQLAVDNNYLILLLQYHGEGLEAIPDFEAGKVKQCIIRFGSLQLLQLLGLMQLIFYQEVGPGRPGCVTTGGPVSPDSPSNQPF